ncbi:uncharacterized protein LOC114419301 isoform X2 [Glycine soja]|uniref:uncharacterized protein LOC114419301 isoform X2 n=1 Tax=Glycine soja TaxID=3848 RepID=UPI00103D6E36|nr:uncharacterized protein LOC114419301 isoform X2 [Glycine soja]
MARTSLSSISIPFLILLIIAFTFFAQLAPVSADLQMRKLGPMRSPPPPPKFFLGPGPGRSGNDAPPPPSIQKGDQKGKKIPQSTSVISYNRIGCGRAELSLC